MDKILRFDGRNSIVLTGIGMEVSNDVRNYLVGLRDDLDKISLGYDCMPTAFLKSRKTLKYMSKQDRISVSAAGKAITMAQIEPDILSEKTGLFMSVGYIPFEREEAERLAVKAQEDKMFSMKKFSTEGYDSINPLLTFACLPNMPAHHISANFGLTDEYYVTYPGTPETYMSLQEAACALIEKRIETAIVGGVADQHNFLVENHYRKTCPGQKMRLADAAGFMVLRLEDRAGEKSGKNLVRLKHINITSPPPGNVKLQADIHLGAADLIVKLAIALEKGSKMCTHSYFTREDTFESLWELL